jgi:hypothetical protein
MFSQRPALRLVQRRRHALAQRRPLERRAHTPLVESVPALVHRGEERQEVVPPRSGSSGGRRRARRWSRTDAPSCRAGTGPTSRRTPRTARARARSCAGIGNGPRMNGSSSVVALRRRAHEVPGVSTGEDLADLGRPHPGLEVLEEHVVRVVVRREALDVPAPEVDHPLERGPERGEVRVLACAGPTRRTTRPPVSANSTRARRHAPRRSQS